MERRKFIKWVVGSAAMLAIPNLKKDASASELLINNSDHRHKIYMVPKEGLELSITAQGISEHRHKYYIHAHVVEGTLIAHVLDGVGNMSVNYVSMDYLEIYEHMSLVRYHKVKKTENDFMDVIHEAMHEIKLRESYASLGLPYKQNTRMFISDGREMQIKYLHTSGKMELPLGILNSNIYTAKKHYKGAIIMKS